MVTLFLQHNCSRWVNRFRTNSQKTEHVSESTSTFARVEIFFRSTLHVWIQTDIEVTFVRVLIAVNLDHQKNRRFFCWENLIIYQALHSICNCVHLTSFVWFSNYYNPSARIMTTPLILCELNFIHECWDLQFKVDFEQEIFEKLFIAIYQTFIIGYYNNSVRIMDLVSHTTYVVCFNFVHKCPNDRFFEKVWWQFYLLSDFLLEICWEEIAEEILFVFRFNVRLGTRTLGFRLISQHTTY